MAQRQGRARVLVLFERGPAGTRALAQARQLSQGEDGQLTVITLAPTSPPARCAGFSARDYDRTVRDSAQQDLDEARRLLGSAAGAVAFEVVVVDGGDGSIARRAAGGAFDVILLPGRRWQLSGRGHPLAAALRAATTAQVRVVSA